MTGNDTYARVCTPWTNEHTPSCIRTITLTHSSLSLLHTEGYKSLEERKDYSIDHRSEKMYRQFATPSLGSSSAAAGGSISLSAGKAPSAHPSIEEEDEEGDSDVVIFVWLNFIHQSVDQDVHVCSKMHPQDENRKLWPTFQDFPWIERVISYSKSSSAQVKEGDTYDRRTTTDLTERRHMCVRVKRRFHMLLVCKRKRNEHPHIYSPRSGNWFATERKAQYQFPHKNSMSLCTRFPNPLFHRSILRAARNPSCFRGNTMPSEAREGKKKKRNFCKRASFWIMHMFDWLRILEKRVRATGIWKRTPFSPLFW